MNNASLRNWVLGGFALLSVAACNTPDPDFAIVFPTRIAFSAARQYPEGIAYAPSLGQFVVSSLTQGKVGTVDDQGQYADLFTDARLIGSVGLKVFNNKVYACNGDQGVSVKSTPQTTLTTAGLFIYNIATRQIESRVRLDSLLPGVPHFANDIALDPAGNAYVTDSFAPVIYKIAPDGKTPTIFVNNPLFAGATGFNLNGIVYHPDGYLIVVKSNEGKLFRVDVAPPNNIYEITGVNLPNGDGMVLYNNDLYVVNNRNRVSQVRSTDGWITASIVKTDSVGYDQATTNVVVNGQVYTLNARINETSAAAMAKNPAQLQAGSYSIQQFK